MDIFDLCSIQPPTESNVIKILKSRFENNKFSILASDILLVISSDKNTKEELQDVRSQNIASLLSEPGHLFSYLSKIYRQLSYDYRSHIIMINGETQSGKTQVMNQISLFLSARKPEIASVWECTQVILDAITCIPINDKASSSRSMQKRKIFFDKEGNCTGGQVIISGLELPRVSILSNSHRNFNIFYYLVEGLSVEERETYNLPRDCEYWYLRFIGEKDSFIYREKLLNLKTALKVIGINNEQIVFIFNTISAILLLGNINLSFRAPGLVEIKNKDVVKLCAKLLSIDPSILKQYILENDPDLAKCKHSVDELSMVLYSQITNWIIVQINIKLQENILYKKGQSFISIMDHYGFDPTNQFQSPSELFINIINENSKALYCKLVKKHIDVDLKYSESCIRLLSSIEEIFYNQYNSPVSIDELYKLIQKLCVNNPFGSVSNMDDSYILEYNHFFRNISYDISLLNSFIQFSNTKTLSSIYSILLESLSWMENNFFKLKKPNTSTLFINDKLKHFDVDENIEPHFICCLRPNINEKTFSDSCILRQLKSHGIMKLLSENIKTVRMKSEEILLTNKLVVANEYSSSSSEIIVPRNINNKKPNKLVGMIRKSSSHHSLADKSKDLIDSSSIPIRRVSQNKQKIRSTKLSDEDIFIDKPGKKAIRPKSLRFKFSDHNIDNHSVEDISAIIPSIDEIEADVDSLGLSSDNLTDISELSEETFDPFVSWKSTMTKLPQKDVQSAIKISNISSNPKTTVNHSIYKKRKDEFLFLYSCGSLLRTIYKQDDGTVSMALLSPHRLSEKIAFNISSSNNNSLKRANSVEENDENLTISGRKKSKADTDSSPVDEPELKSEWKGLEQAERTPDLVNWEKRSVKMRKHKSILPLLKLNSGDAVINQINYNNSIRPTPRRQKPIIAFIDIQEVSFESYAENRFLLPKKLLKAKQGSSKYRSQLKKLISASKSAITTPLHPLRAPLESIAIENFKHILLYMLLKSGSNRSKEAMTHIRAVVRNGLERSTLRDEIYCQLVKQTYNNLKEKYSHLVWELMAICAGCFAPSYFLKNLVKYLDDNIENSGEIGAWASFCKDRLLKTVDQGKRLFVPIQRELNAVQERKPIIEIFYFADGKQKQIPIYSSTTAEEALEFLLQMIGLKQSQGYMIYEQYKIIDEKKDASQIIERSLLYSEVLCTSLSKFEQFNTSFANKTYITTQTCFIVKRKLFIPNDDIDIVERNLLFHQVSDMIRNGELLVIKRDALLLGGLYLLITKGPYKQTFNKKQIRSKEIIPKNIIESLAAREWRKLLLERYKDTSEMTIDEGKQLYIEYCTTLPFYGYHLFHVSILDMDKTWELPENFYIGINIAGLFFLNEQKKVFYSFSFLDILTYSATPHFVTFGFDNSSKIKLRSIKGDEIISLIVDYKYLELTNEL